MGRAWTRLVRTGVLLGAVLGLATGTFLLLDLFGLTGFERFLTYLLVTTAIAAGILFYTAFVVVDRSNRPLEDTGD